MGALSLEKIIEAMQSSGENIIKDKYGFYHLAKDETLSGKRLIDDKTCFEKDDFYVLQTVDKINGKKYSLGRQVLINPISKELSSLYNTLKTKLDKYKSSNINISPLILKEVQSFVEKTLKGENNAFKKYEEGTVESFLDEAIKNKSGDEVDAALTTWVLLSMLKNDNYIRGDARIKSFYNPKKKRVEVVCKYRTSHGVEIPISFYK